MCPERGIFQSAFFCRAADAQNGFCAHIPQKRRRRTGGAARAEDQAFFTGNMRAQMQKQAAHAEIIGVISVKLSAAIDHGIYGADGCRRFIHSIQKRKHRRFIRNGDVDRAERAPPQKRLQLLRLQLVQLIAIAAERLVNRGGKAVPQRQPDQTVFHLTPPAKSPYRSARCKDRTKPAP